MTAAGITTHWPLGHLAWPPIATHRPMGHLGIAVNHSQFNTSPSIGLLSSCFTLIVFIYYFIFNCMNISYIKQSVYPLYLKFARNFIYLTIPFFCYFTCNYTVYVWILLLLIIPTLNVNICCLIVTADYFNLKKHYSRPTDLNLITFPSFCNAPCSTSLNKYAPILILLQWVSC